MGNKPAERKRKKKGRPSLLDLQKLQQEEQEKSQPKKNPNPRPHLRLPAAPSGLAATHRNPNPDASSAGCDDDDDDDDSNGKRREKKLKLVLRIPNSANSASELDDGDRRKGERNNSSKGTTALQGEPSDSGPTTPLPDKKLLEFILDRLQKKDTYGVFAEPVDPEELPDYHEIIEHPMDFATVRKKLSSGEYANLEQFEEDVFLISSNAMQYNSPDTIYYRQARAIQELAKKNFENFRQESDDNEPEPEPKTIVRRGRPPSKNIKGSIGRPPIDRAASDFSSSATLANAGEGTYRSNLIHDLSRKGSASDRPGFGAVPVKSYNLRPTEPYSLAAMLKLESNEEFSGYGSKGNSSKYGKRFPVIDENRRDTCRQPQPSTFAHEPSKLTAFGGEWKQLVTVGVHIEHAYARSLVRFAANLGPIGWAIAAKKIERVLPPRTKFGRGWIGESEAPKPPQSQPHLLSSPHAASSNPNVSTCTTVPQGDKLPQKVESSNGLAIEGCHLRITQTPTSTSITSSRSETLDVAAVSRRGLNHEGGSNLLIGGCGGGGSGGGSSNIQSKAHFQLHQNLEMQPTANGCTDFGFNVRSQVGKMVRPARPLVPFCSDAQVTHSRALDMVSKGSIGSDNGFCQLPPMHHLDVERPKLVSNSGMKSSKPLPVLAHNQNPEGAWQSLSQPMKQDSLPP